MHTFTDDMRTVDLYNRASLRFVNKFSKTKYNLEHYCFIGSRNIS